MNQSTTNTQSLRRQAFIDGQLSVEEVIAFQEDQSAEEKALLDQEIAFEKAFAKTVGASEGPSCPDALWEDLQNRILREDTHETTPQESAPATPAPRRFWGLQALMAAAAIIIAATVVNRYANDRTSDVVVASMLDNNLDKFVANAEIKGDVTVIRKALAETAFADVDLLSPDPDAHHNVEFLGMSHETVNGKPAVRLYVSCCNRPASIILTSAEELAPTIAQSDNGASWYQARKRVGKGEGSSALSFDFTEEI